ncbi:MAG: 7-carboxy-7-deazaguanine synthase QueE [Kiritimatiellia bacterium]
MNKSITYPVVEIFKSLQGEGFNTGRAMVFIRFGGCNLACPWCDTPYNDFKMRDAEYIIRTVEGFGIKSLLITGGEPLIVKGLKALLEYFRHKGFWIAVETNGVDAADDGIVNLFDYITVSPKAFYADFYHKEPAVCKADELRVVADGNVLEFCRFISGKIKADHYFLSPCEQKGKMNIRECVRLLGWLNQSSEDPHWQLSVQTHKLCGMK